MPNFLDSLFPHDPAYDGLLSVQRIRDLQRSSLVRAGIGMMGASAPGPQGQPFGQALDSSVGAAVQNWPQQLSGAAETAANMNTYKQKQDVMGKRQTILASNPQQPGESETQYLRRLYPEFLRAGDMETVGRLTEIIKSNQENREPVHYGSGLHDGKPDQFQKTPGGPVTWLNVPPTERSGQQLLQDQRMFTREDKLTDDYRNSIKPIEEAYAQILPTLSTIDRAHSGDGTAQVDLLYSFVKAMDPTSVVREGELALAAKATPVYGRAKAWLSQYENGKAIVVPPETVLQMADLLKRRMSAYEKRWKSKRDIFVSRAKRWGVDENAFYDAPDTFTQAALANEKAAGTPNPLQQHGAPPPPVR